MSTNTNSNYCFGKSEKLCSKLLIEKLYSSPHRELFFPLSVHWLPVDRPVTEPRVQVLIVAPKRKLRHAVDRNRTKRIIRECYRLRKNALFDALEKSNKHIILSFNYIHTSTPNFNKLSATMDKIIARLSETTISDD